MEPIIILTELILMNHIHWSKETWVEVYTLYTNLHVTLYIEHALYVSRWQPQHNTSWPTSVASAIGPVWTWSWGKTPIVKN
jgi:hypothetical protein